MTRVARVVRITALAGLVGLLLASSAPGGIIRPDDSTYSMSIIKLVLLVALAVASLYSTNWIAGDLNRIIIEPFWWTLSVTGALLGMALSVILIPWFPAGYSVAIVVMGVTVGVYSWQRNRLVPPRMRVFTRAHLVRIRARLAGRRLEEPGAGPVIPVHPITFLGGDDLPIRPTGQSEEDMLRAKLTREMFQNAIGRRATELGLTSRPGAGGQLRLRIDGLVIDGGGMASEESEAAFAEIKRMAGLEVAEARKPQAGRFRAVMAGRTFEIRVRTSGNVRGEQMHIHLIDMVESEWRLADIGMSEKQVADVNVALDAEAGLVILSAPKHSGLTTVLHAMLRHFDRYMKTVVSLEPEVNIEVSNVQHIEMLAQASEEGEAAGQLESVLRGDPHVVAIDSLADEAVAKVVLEAAREHLMIVAVQALDVGQALSQFIGMVHDRKAVARVARLVVNLRLARKICEQCREPYRPRPEFLRKANLTKQSVDLLYRVPAQREERRGKVVVCPGCRNEGFVGRVGFFEVMPVDADARELLASGSSMSELRVHARKSGRWSLQEAGLQRVIEGVTSVDEVLRVMQKSG